MHIQSLHSWELEYGQARRLQSELAGKIRLVSLRGKGELVGGLDCAFSKDGKRIGAVCVVMSVEQLKIVEVVQAVREVEFPYVSGLLSFRESPVCIAAAAKIKNVPNVFIIDGQGIAHPRRFGLACHLGLFFDRPTIGCAKSRLTGNYEEVGLEKGSFSTLMHKGERIGAVVRTRSNVKPVFVSPGHKCTVNDAVRVVLECVTKYRLPEPTRMAHQLVTKMKPSI